MGVDIGGSDLTRFHLGDDLITRMHYGDDLLYVSNLAPISNLITSSVPGTAGSNATVTFTSTVVDDDLTGGTYTWTGGSSGTQTFTHPTTTYSSVGTNQSRSIRCTFTDAGGETSVSNIINQAWAAPQLANFTVAWINPAGGIQPNGDTGSFVDVTPTYTMTNNNAFPVNVSMRFERSGGGGMGGFGFVSFDANGAQSTIGLAPPSFAERWRPDSYQPTGNYPETYNATPTTVPFLANVRQTMGGNIRTVLATSDQTLSWIWIISASGFSNLEIAPPNGGYRRTS